MKIVLVEYINRNLGDSAIAENTCYFINEILESAHIQDYSIHEYNMYTEDMEYLRHADLIIFVGGGLIKYKREKLYHFIPQIISEAHQRGIPVFINCAGVEGYDDHDERCQALKMAVNDSCVKGITIRDDFKTFCDCYLTTHKEWLGKVMDPAAFSGETYNINRIKTSNVIGLGVARYGLFEDYGFKEVTEEKMLCFWKDTIELLEQQGNEWEIFGNGLLADYEFQVKLLKYIDRESEIQKRIVRRPAYAKELANTIANYKGIIACRLHANIIAYSLGVPSIGLVWNEKLLFWGRDLGLEERFLLPEQLKGSIAVERLNTAINENRIPNCTEEKNKIIDPLKSFIHKYGVRTDQKDLPSVQWKEHLIANSMGGIAFKYIFMNSSDFVQDKYQEGYRIFKTELKLTSDGVPVCVRGWNEAVFKRLGLDEETYNDMKDGMPYELFEKSVYYEHFKTMNLLTLIEFMNSYADVHLILDVRCDSVSELETIADCLQKRIGENTQKRTVIRIVLKREFDVFSTYLPYVRFMTDYPNEQECEKYNICPKDIDYLCGSEKTEWISIRKKQLTDELLEQLRRYQKKYAVFTYNSLGEVLELLKKGIDWIGTDYLSVNDLNRLMD